MIQLLEKALTKLSTLPESEQEIIANLILTKIEDQEIVLTKTEPEKNAWELLEDMAGSMEAPEDWSQEHDHYLYGTSKQCTEND